MSKVLVLYYSAYGQQAVRLTQSGRAAVTTVAPALQPHLSPRQRTG